MNKKQIQDKISFLRQHHAGRINQQKLEETYYKDTFPVYTDRDANLGGIKTVVRLGTAARLIDVPAASIITSNPKVYVEAINNTEKARENARKRGVLLNNWTDWIIKQQPQPILEAVKNALLRGEGWFHIIPNQEWSGVFNSIPIYFSAPDPINIKASPNEINGIPDCVLVEYERDYNAIQNKYEHWSNPKKRKGSDNMVKWLELWTNEERYFEADGEPVLGRKRDGTLYSDGSQPNIMGVVPYVHFYSGFGKADEGRDPKNLAVGRLRYILGRLKEECEVESDIATINKRHAHPRIDIRAIDRQASADKLRYSLSYGALNEIPFGFEVNEHIGEAPAQQSFEHLYSIKRAILDEQPPIMQGIITGTSGRQEDIAGANASRKYAALVDNLSNAFSIALSIGMKMLVECDMLPVTTSATTINEGVGIRKELKIEDETLDDFYCRVEMKADNPIEEDRKAMLGDKMQSQGILDWKTNLIQYHGYTDEEAQEIINNTLVDTVLYQNPQVKEILAMAVLETLGMNSQLEAIKQQQQMQQQQQAYGQVGPRGGEPRTGNIQNPQAFEQADMLLTQRGVRRSPSG